MWGFTRRFMLEYCLSTFMGRNQKYTYLPDDVKQEFDEFCDNRGITDSEALKRFTRDALKERGYDV